MDEAAELCTQIPADRAYPLMASLASGEMLGSFSVQTFDSCKARAGSSQSLECFLQVACEGLDPPKASFAINAAGVAVVEGAGMIIHTCLFTLFHRKSAPTISVQRLGDFPLQGINLATCCRHCVAVSIGIKPPAA